MFYFEIYAEFIYALYAYLVTQFVDGKFPHEENWYDELF